jgi:O-antigen/teichoic acid export membrane protein
MARQSRLRLGDMRWWSSRSTASIASANQAMLSLLSLATAFLIIASGEKSEYAKYMFATTSVLLILSIQNALITSPLITIYHAAKTEDRSIIEQTARSIHFKFMCGIAAISVLIFVGMLFSESMGVSEYKTVAAASIAVMGALVREHARSINYLIGNFWLSLKLDSIFVVAIIATLMATYKQYHLNADLALTATGTVALLTGTVSLGITKKKAFDAPADNGLLRELWQCSRWTLPSVVVSWCYSNGYVFIVGALIGTVAVADMSAARLFMMPLTLIFVGWASSYRPKSTNLFSKGEIDEVLKIARHSIFKLGWCTVGYSIVILSTYKFAELLFSVGNYSNLDGQIIAWSIYMLITMIRSVGMNTMMVSKNSFRPLFFFGTIAMVVGLILTTISSISHYPIGVIMSLATSELVLLLLIWLKGWPSVVLEKSVRT